MENNNKSTNKSEVGLKNLLYCPLCGFTYEKYEKHNALMGGNQVWDNYKPLVKKSELLNELFVECQNCGGKVLFGEKEQEATIRLWNDIERSGSV